MSSLLAFPREILFAIWNYLTHHERLRTRLVCHDLAEVGGQAIESGHSCKLQHLTVQLSEAFPNIRGFYVSGKRMLQHLVNILGERRASVRVIATRSCPAGEGAGLLRLFKNLNEVHFEAVTEREILFLEKTAQQLTRLRFSTCDLALPGEQLSNLQRLTVRCKVSDRAVLSLVPHCRQLREIDIGPESNISHYPMSQLLGNCPQLCSLTNVSFRNTALMAHIPTLTKLGEICDEDGTLSHLCHLIENGFRPHSITIDECFDQHELQALRLCRNVKDLHIDSVGNWGDMDELSRMFGTTVEELSLPIRGRSLPPLPLAKFYNLRCLQCPFSESIQMCTQLRHLVLHLYKDAPATALERLGSQLMHLEKLVLCGAPPLAEVERLCSSPHMFAELSSLKLVDHCMEPPRDPQWINMLKELAKRYRPILHVTWRAR